MHWLWLILIVPGLIALYAIVIRGLLHKVPALQKFYAEADGFWAKVWAICGKSVTIAWGQIIGGIGSGLALLDPIAAQLGDPGLKDQITAAIGNPKIVGWVMVGISVITILARLRSLGKGA